jgi:hypothetical protein
MTLRLSPPSGTAEPPNVSGPFMAEFAPAFGDFLFNVRGLRRQDDQVCGVVVVLVSVQMMNNFPLLKRTPDLLFGNDTMDCLPTNLVIIRRVVRHVLSAIPFGAIEAAALSDFGQGRVKSITTGAAKSSLACPPRLGVTDLRTPTLQARFATGETSVVHDSILGGIQATANRWFSPGCRRPSSLFAGGPP